MIRCKRGIMVDIDKKKRVSIKYIDIIKNMYNEVVAMSELVEA